MPDGKKEEAFKKKGSTSFEISLGVVSLIFAFFCIEATILINRTPTDTTDPSILAFLCCSGFSILFGITAIILIPYGFIRRHKLNSEINAAESEIRMHLIAQEEMRSADK